MKKAEVVKGQKEQQKFKEVSSFIQSIHQQVEKIENSKKNRNSLKRPKSVTRKVKKSLIN